MQTNTSSALSTSTAISFSKSCSCSHPSLYRRDRNILCDYCNLVYSLYSFQVKSKCSLDRTTIHKLVGCDFSTFHSKCLHLNPTCVAFAHNVEDSSDSESSSEHVSSVPALSECSFETFCNFYSSNFCAHAEHLFECSSARDSSRGRLFPVCRKSVKWYATCATCSASCEFATPRAQSLIGLFLYFCKFKVCGNNFFVTSKHSQDWALVSKSSMEIAVRVLGADISPIVCEGEAFEPTYVVPKSDVGSNFSTVDNFHCIPMMKFPSVIDHTEREECDHEFFLTDEVNIIPITRSMLRIFMLLIPGFGYFHGKRADGAYVDDSAGIISIGGLMGVNALCNQLFVEYHSNFYNGCTRENPTIDEFYRRTYHSLHSVEITAESQMDSDEGIDEVSRNSEIYEDSEEEEEAIDLEDQYRAFMENDDPLFEIEAVPRVAGRGFKNRIGGLLKGIANCVKKLHAVWDYPLDVAVNIAEKTGNWMEKNKEFVDKDVWSCTMCHQLSKNQLKSAEAVEKEISLLREGVKRLAMALDKATGHYGTNLKELEDRIKLLEERLSSPITTQTGVDESVLDEKLDVLRRALLKNIATQSVNYAKGLTKVAQDLNDLANVVHNLPKSDKPRFPIKKKKPIVDEIGEQLPIPRDRVVAQMDLTEDKIVNPEEVVSRSVINSLVQASGANDLHSAIEAKHLVSSFDWSVSSGRGKVLADIVMPNAIFNMNERMKDIASYFQFYTCDGLDFEISLTSLMMQGGTLYICWDSMSCATIQKVDSVLQLSGLPGEFVQASSSSVTKFSVSNPSIQHIMCLSGTEKSMGTLGTLKICCANGLNSPADASQKVRVHVWVKFRNPRFSFISLKHKLVLGQMDSLKSLESKLGELEAIVLSGVWSTSSPDNLCEIVVHPTCSNVSGGLITQTPLSVVSHVYARWRGSLKYRIVFGASMYVKGKLQVTAVPSQFRQMKLSLNQMTGFPCLICDLSGDERIFDFEVPYHSVAKNSLVCRNALFDISNYDAELVTTRLHMVVLDPLIMNANASNSIDFVVTCRPGDSFELLGPHGVHAESVNRVISQLGFQSSPDFRGLMGQGFNMLVDNFSKLVSFKLDNNRKNVMSFAVSPTYRSMAPCTTLISWFAQLFIQWRGELTYELRAHSFDKNRGCFVRVWYEPNGSTESGNDFEYLTGVDPPSGNRVKIWFPADGNFQFTAPFTARTDKLMIQKPRYEPNPADWLRCYNGVFYLDYEGSESLDISLWVAGGADFEMFERTVAPRCGRVTKAFTKLSYAPKLLDVADAPVFNRPILRGPFSRAKVDPVSFQPVKGVDEEPPAVDDDHDEPREGDVAEDEDGSPVVYRRGEWVYPTTKQMDCCMPLNFLGDVTKTFEDHDTCKKVADIVDTAHALTGDLGKADASNLVEVMNLLLPVLKCVNGSEESVSSGLLDTLRVKVLGLLKPLLDDSIPGLIKCAFEQQEYVWATIITLVGGAFLFWATKKVKGFKKKFAALCMIIWAPFLKNRIWDLGNWIKTLWKEKFTGESPCRKHSIAGMTEGANMLFGVFSEWFKSNWTSVVESLLSVLGVVASLIIWGSVPDGKKLTSFSSIFKEVGEKGKTISNILTGWSSINKVVKEWSAKFTSWMLSTISGSTPSADSALQIMLDFNLKEWVKEVRELSLMENKYTDFGSEDYLLRVRRLYDKSQQIQQKLLDGCKVDMQLSMILKECKEKCTELLNESYTFKGMKKPRIDPFHVCLLGAPGVGKSTIAHILINDMMNHKNVPEVDRIYTRCCADAYWSNYHQEPVILYDDLGAIKSGIKMSDYAEIMGVKSNDPYSVPMAGVNDKGRHCTSKFVFSCTNHLHLDDTGDVTEKNAYYRRRNLLVEIERDEEIPRDPEDPTKGLLFTVIGHEFVGVDKKQVRFYYPDTWDEPFLRGVKTDDWYFYQVDYDTFLNFANVYSDKYMEHQEILLKSISSIRSRPKPSSEVQKQMDERTVSLGALIDQFDSLKLTGKDVCQLIKNAKIVAPCGWNTSKVVTLDFLKQRLCGCYDDEMCDFNIALQLLAQNVGNSIRSTGGSLMHTRFGFRKVAKDPRDIVLVVKGDSDDLKGIDYLSVIVSLISWSRMCDGDDVCPYLRNKVVGDTKIILALDDLDSDDRIRFDSSFIPSGKNNALLWGSVRKFYGKIIDKFGFVAVFDGENYYVLLEDVSRSKPTSAQIEECWLYLLSNGMSVMLDPLFLMRPKRQYLAKLLLMKVSNWDLMDDNAKSLKEIMSEAKSTFGLNGELISFALILVSESQSRFSQNKVNVGKAKNLKKIVQACDNFLTYEQTMVPKLSGFVKIGLALAGGILCVGSLIGLIFGAKKLIDSMLGLFVKDPEPESEMEITYEDIEANFDDNSYLHTQCRTGRCALPDEALDRLVDEKVGTVKYHLCDGKEAQLERKMCERAHEILNKFDKEPAHAQLSGAQESEKDETPHKRNGRIPPQVRGVKEKGYSQMCTGAQESENNETKHMVNKRLPPAVRLMKESGFGVTYSDVDTQVPVKILKRKNFRSELVNAEKHIAQGRKSGAPALVHNIGKWQKRVLGQGVNISDIPAKFVPASLDVSLNAQPEQEYSTNDDNFEVKKPTAHTLQCVIDESKVSTKGIVENKFVGGVHKQIKVGAMSLERDPSMTSLLVTHVSKMSCVIYDATRQITCNVLRLKGTIIAMPCHYLEELLEDHECYFICPNKVVRVQVDYSRMALVSTEQDLLVWDLGNNVPPSTDYTKHIMTAEDWKHFVDGSGALSMTRYNEKHMMQMIHALDSIERIRADVQVPTGTYDLFGSTHTIVSGVRYRMNCMVGFCGAAILRGDPRKMRKICALHVAGHSERGVGYGEMLILENILAAIEALRVDPGRKLNGENLENSPVELCDKQIDPIRELGNLGQIGYVADCEIPTIPTKTTICKSIIHGLVGDVKTAPAILSTWDKRLGDKRTIWDPVMDAVAKYGSEIVPFHDGEIQLVEEHLIQSFKRCNNSLKKREVNNLEIGINGIDLTDYWNPIEMKTSSGWPYCKRKPAGAAGKSWMFEQVGTYPSGRPVYEMKDEGLLESYNKMLNQCKSGVPPCVVTMECPKDERRKLSKIIDKPATRTFTILPPEVNILFRQFFGDFAAMVMLNRAHSFCQVGINPSTLEWSELMNNFLKVSRKGFAGDYAKFDGISPASIYHSIVNVVNAWYNDGEENALIRHCLLSSIVHRKGIAKDMLLQYSQGMPSGFAMTVIFNSFVNYYFMALSWMSLVGMSKYSPEAGLSSFDRYCKIIVYGDDNVVAVDEEFLEVFNLRTVASYLFQYGITYTDDAKNPIHLSEPYVDITSVTFLKRNFTPLGTKGGTSRSLWKACLDKTSIEERLNWVRDCDDLVGALNQNVDSALFEACVWGQDYFDDLNGRLSKAYDQVLLTYPEPCYNDYQRMWWSSMTGGQPSQVDLHKLVTLSKLNQIDLSSKLKDVFYKEDKSLLAMLQDAIPLRELRLELKA